MQSVFASSAPVLSVVKARASAVHQPARDVGPYQPGVTLMNPLSGRSDPVRRIQEQFIPTYSNNERGAILVLDHLEGLERDPPGGDRHCDQDDGEGCAHPL